MIDRRSALCDRSAGVLAFGGGFAWFVHLVDRPGQAPPHADGIVAFTGGPERVETALRLLAEDRADRLLLSGIGGGAELAELAHRAGVDPLPLASRVTIDRNAATTRGNATETADWARANAIRSLLVVTASYHMPRAIAELARALPEVDPLSAACRAGRAARPARHAVSADRRGIHQVPCHDGGSHRRAAGARADPGPRRPRRMTLLRSALFNVFFFAMTFLLTVAPATAVRLVAPHRVLDVARLWARVMVWGVRVICGIRLQVSGLEHVGSGAALIASQHQSAFDTFVWLTLVPRCCYVLKQRTAAHPAVRPADAAHRHDRGGSQRRRQRAARAATGRRAGDP